MEETIQDNLITWYFWVTGDNDCWYKYRDMNVAGMLRVDEYMSDEYAVDIASADSGSDVDEANSVAKVNEVNVSREWPKTQRLEVDYDVK